MRKFDDHDGREADVTCGIRLDSQQNEPETDRFAEGRSGICAGENPDQSDAHLHRRQEAARLGGEIERSLGPRATAWTIARRRASRDETIASSLIDRTALRAIRARMRTRSRQGNGSRGSLIGVKHD